MPSSIEQGYVWQALFSYRLVSQEGPEGARCRCGIRLGRGTASFRFEKVPAALDSLLSSERFCSSACARAFVLEALALTESSAAPTVLSDYEEVLRSLRVVLNLIDLERMAVGNQDLSP
jgi:hypothetical protein